MDSAPALHALPTSAARVKEESKILSSRYSRGVGYRGPSVPTALKAQLSRQCRHAELMERSTSSAWKGVARTS